VSEAGAVSATNGGNGAAGSSPGAGGLSPEVRNVAIVVIVGAIMSILDTTIVNVALESLSRDLHSSLADIQWVATGYMLALAAVIPVSGWAAEKVGARRLWIASVVLFTLGSALCGAAWSTGSLVAFRVLQGLGGGMIMPIGQMVLARAAGPQQMGRVMGVIGVPMILAPVFGPTLGGLLLEHLGWRWIFYVNLPIGIIGVILALRLLPAVQSREAPPFDKVGFALLATGVPLLVYGLAEIGQQGGMGAGSLGPMVAGIVLIAAFVLHALRTTTPLVNVRLFANRAFSAASMTTFALGAGLFGAMIIMPLYFQIVRGEDAVHTGLLLIPQGVGAAIAMPLAGRAADRIGGGRVAVAGLLATLVATLPFALIGAHTSYWLIGTAMIARGFGIGMTMMPAMSAAYASLRPSDIAHATPQLNVLQRVGGSIGTAILTVVLQNGISDRVAAAGRTAPDVIAPAFSNTYWWVFAVTAVALLPALLLARVEGRRRGRPAAPPETTLEPVGA
jgi:EmrB/QacA subfamily drug resistance transporter